MNSKEKLINSLLFSLKVFKEETGVDIDFIKLHYDSSLTIGELVLKNNLIKLEINFV